MKPIGINPERGIPSLLTSKGQKPNSEQDELTLPTPPDGDNSTSTKAESSSNEVLNYMANGAVYNQLSIAQTERLNQTERLKLKPREIEPSREEPKLPLRENINKTMK